MGKAPRLGGGEGFLEEAGLGLNEDRVMYRRVFRAEDTA